MPQTPHAVADAFIRNPANRPLLREWRTAIQDSARLAGAEISAEEANRQIRNTLEDPRFTTLPPQESVSQMTRAAREETGAIGIPRNGNGMEAGPDIQRAAALFHDPGYVTRHTYGGTGAAIPSAARTLPPGRGIG